METMIPYDDSCVITRATSEKDEWGDPVMTEVYSGSCNYQKGQPTLGSLLIHSDILFLPKNDVVVRENDTVIVTAKKGRKYSGVVKSVLDAEFVVFDIEETKVELKQVMEVWDDGESV
jgi:small nuclear ribonucleoprotein (snRNP)-like protein